MRKRPEKRRGAPWKTLTQWLWIAALPLGSVSCGPSDSNFSEERTGTEQQSLQLAGATWTPQGPGPITGGPVTRMPPNDAVSGAVHVVLPHPTNVNTMFIGAVNGGIWRTTNATATNPTWTPLTDLRPSISVSSLEFDPQNSQTLIAGTGSLSSLGAQGTQAGLLLSRNGGNSWTEIPSTQISTNPSLDGQIFTAVAIRGNTLLANAFPFGGVFRSTNGGTSWTRISEAPGSGLPVGFELQDVAGDPSNTSRFYASAFNDGVYLSSDQGATWTKVSQNDATLDAAFHSDAASFLINVEMAVGRNGRLYVGVSRLFLDGSEPASRLVLVATTSNQGASWQIMPPPAPDFEVAGIFFSVAVDPTDASIVYVGGIRPQQHARGDRRLPAGQQWTFIASDDPVNGNAPHPDSRDMVINAAGNLVDGSDGGVALRSSPRSATGTWRGLNGNLQITEIHDVTYDPQFRFLAAATQDNGTPVQPALGKVSWPMLFGGDGGDVQVDPLSLPGQSILYSSAPLARTPYGPGGPQRDTFILLAGGSPPPLQFITPLELNRVNPRRLVFGGADAVFESFDQGDTVVSLDAGPFSRALAYGHPGNPDVLYAVPEGGPDAGQLLVRLAAGGPLVRTAAFFPTGDAQDVVIDPRNFRRVFAIGHSQVFVTQNSGGSFTDITGNLPSLPSGRLRSIDFVPSATGSGVVVGADRGVFATLADSPGVWQEVGSNLPNAPVFDLVYGARDDLLGAGLLGRSAWTVTGLAAGNLPPVARCRDVIVDADNACGATVTSAQINNGTTDPNGNAFSCVVSPAGPFAVGSSTQVFLTCTDSRGAESTCAATVHVGVGDNPNCCPAGTNRIVGTSGGDNLVGTEGSDCIVGLGGGDVIDARGGNDFVSGGAGDDTIVGGFGDDFITGGPGNDTIDSGPGNDKLGGGDGTDTCAGGGGNDVVLGCE